MRRSSWFTGAVGATGLALVFFGQPLATLAADTFTDIKTDTLQVTGRIFNSDGKVRIKDGLAIRGKIIDPNTKVVINDGLKVVKKVVFERNAGTAAEPDLDVAGYADFDGTVDVAGATVTGLGASDLSDSSSVAMLGEDESVTGNWLIAGTTGTNFTIDSDSATADQDLTLTFNDNGVAEMLTWDGGDDKFALSDDLDIDGAVTANNAVFGTGSISADEVGNITRSINFPVTSLFQMTGTGAPQIVQASATTADDGIYELALGSSPGFRFQDDGSSEQYGASMIVPDDYTGDGTFVFRVQKDGDTGADEYIRLVANVEDGLPGTADSADITGLAIQTVSIPVSDLDPTSPTLAPGQSIGWTIQNAGAGPDDGLMVYGIEFQYTAVQ